HKFDPISQKEFYQLFAFFNHTVDVNNVGPTVDVSEGELLLESIDPKLRAELDEAKAAFAKLTKTKSKRQTAWEQTALVAGSEQPQAEWKTLVATELHAAGGAKLQTLEDHSILAGQGAAMETYTVRFPSTVVPVAALRLRVLPHDSLPKNGPGRAGNGNFILSQVEILVGGKPVAIDHVQSDHAQPGHPVTNIINGSANSGWAINIGKGSRAGVKMNAPHEAHLVFAEPLPSGSDSLTVILRHEVNANYNIGRFALDVASGPSTTACVTNPSLLNCAGPVSLTPHTLNRCC
ncbi:MAG: hypothetical protein GY826_30505, partial [Fuerstiella sp.]|nr:hypothetical protein [Fuerstiella sp.]